MSDILKDLVFTGKVKKNFTICDFSFTFSTLSKKDEEEIEYLEKQKKLHSHTVHFVVEILIKTIVRINYIELCKDDIKKILYSLPLAFLIKLYNGYKTFNTSIITEINSNFVEFLNSKESDMQWEILRAGFLWEQPLNEIQKSWIYYRKQIEKNKEFESQYHLAKYIISHVTHATINPKTYVNMIRKEQHQENAKELQEQGEYTDLTKEYFDQILASKKDPEKVNEIFKNSIDNKDEHDLAMLEHSKQVFKSEIRYRRNMRFTMAKQKRPDIVVGYKQESSTLDGKVATSIFIRDGINYEDIFKDKKFFDLTYEMKMQLFEEVLLEDVQEVDIKEVRHPIAKEKKKYTTDVAKNGKTIREILKEKGQDGK